MVSKENKNGVVSPPSLQTSLSPKDPSKVRTSPKSQATALEDETKRILGSRSGTIERVVGYTPSLEEFASTSFSDYVRGTLLGVDLNYNSNSSNAEPQAAESCHPRSPQTHVVGVQFSPNCDSYVGSPTNTSTFLPPKTNQNPTKEKSPHDKNVAITNLSASSDAGGHQASSSMTTRSQRRRAASARSQTCTASSAIPRTVVTPVATRKKDGPQIMCKYKFSDGVAKVTPPCGWWDMSGVGNDLTMRGPAWQAGTRLGDMVISDPIKQCASGIGGVYDYTMLELPPITVSEFGKKADKYRKSQVGSEFDEDTSDEFLDGLARKFWRRLGPTMEASQYGADMTGTLFQGAKACGWNVNQLESCLQLLKADANDDASLPGVTSAYLYVGMWASVFAAHTEDMKLLSINYLHAGAPKYWYSICPEDSQRFESYATSRFGTAASECPEFLRHKRYLISPALLKKAGIRYKTLIQRAGDIVITFPGAYHFGFNTGYNMAESTNFAVPEWIPFGDTARVCMCHPHSVRIDMNRYKTLFDAYENDMIEASKNGSSGMTYSEWAKQERTKRNELRDQEEQSLSKEDHDKALCEPVLPKVSYNKGIVVEAMKSAPRRCGSTVTPKKRSTKPTKKKQIEDWRMALKVRASTFTPQTPVLCFIPCELDIGNIDGTINSGKESEKFFCGTITQVVEGHARIHFAGTTRKEDIWLPTNSPRMFLDGGPEDPPHTKNNVKTPGKRRVESSGSQKKKLKTP